MSFHPTTLKTCCRSSKARTFRLPIPTNDFSNKPRPRLPTTMRKSIDEDVELDLSAGALEKTNDPVRLYLREMGVVPLLTREGEVAIAKRIERGQLKTQKAIARSPIAVKELLRIGEELEAGKANIREIVTFLRTGRTDRRRRQSRRVSHLDHRRHSEHQQALQAGLERMGETARRTEESRAARRARS